LYGQNKGRPTFQKVWDDKEKGLWIRGRKDSSHLSSAISLKHITKGNQLKVKSKQQMQWEKGQDNIP
jgi:hypothetical protein